MIAAGIDLGGTKIEMQLFDKDWHIVDRKRVPTPQDYPTLLQDLTKLINWANAQGHRPAIGVGTAGVFHATSGNFLAANLCANGHPFRADLETIAKGPIAFLNDARAFAVSEALFGAGRSYQRMFALTLGTGVGGSCCVDDALQTDHSGLMGEVGHLPVPAHVISAHSLPIHVCGCGRVGCFEQYIAGPGMSRLAAQLTGQNVTPETVVAQCNGAMQQVWSVWCTLVAELIHILRLTVDPDVIVIGGGLSRIPNLIKDLNAVCDATGFPDMPHPALAIAHGGETSAARGAAYVAWQSLRKREKL